MTPPIQAALDSSFVAAIDDVIQVTTPDGQSLFTVPMQGYLTYQDLYDEAEKRGYSASDYVLTTKTMIEYGPDALVVPRSGDEIPQIILYPRDAFNELTKDTIGSMLDEVTTDYESPIGKHMKRHKKDRDDRKHLDKHSNPSVSETETIDKKLSSKSRRRGGSGEHSTTYYSNDRHNIIAETGSDLVLSDIQNPVSLVGLNRNLINETPISTDHVITRCKAVVRGRKARGDTTNYEDTLTKLELSFDFFHCVNTGRVRIFRRTIHGGCDEGIFAALRVGELQPIGETFDPAAPHIPDMAFDVNALYFLRAPYAAIDNNKIFERVVDDPDRFIDALGFVVLRGKEMPSAEAVEKIAKECYDRRYPPQKPLPGLTPMPECGWRSFWQKLMARTRYYSPSPLARDDDLDRQGTRRFNETYGSLQGSPNTVSSIGDDVNEPSEEKKQFGEVSGFEDAETGGFEGTPDPGFTDYDPEAHEEPVPATTSLQEPQPQASTPASSPISLRKAQTNIPTSQTPERKEALPIDLKAVINGEEFVYTPHKFFVLSPENVHQRSLATDDMTLDDLLKTLSESLYNDHRVRIGVDCMVVHIDSGDNPVISPSAYDQINLNDRSVFVNTPRIRLIIKDGHDSNTRVPSTEESSSTPSSSSSSSEPTSIMAELLDLKTFDDKTDPIGSCVYLEDEHRDFNTMWGRAVNDRTGIFFRSPTADSNPIFEPETHHVVVVPKPSLFKRFSQMFVSKQMQFRQFISSHTFALHSGLQSVNRQQTVESLDKSRKVNLKYKFKPSHNQGFVRVNDTWVPLRRLDLGPGRENYNVYALPYDQSL